jgi:uncharacterized protein (DUF1499 family)
MLGAKRKRVILGFLYRYRYVNRLTLAARLSVATLFLMPLFSCAGTRPLTLGVHDGRLAPCPASPNCVSSDDTEASHRIEPFRLAMAAAEGWSAARAAVAGLPRAKIITDTDNYLHAECSSAFFGFVDDLELHLRPSEGLMAIRSAARLGYSDLDVNRKRAEQLRALLQKQNAIR